METINSVKNIYTTPEKKISKSLISQKIKYKEYKQMLKKSKEKSISESLKTNLIYKF
jgi:hypothetical protein